MAKNTTAKTESAKTAKGAAKAQGQAPKVGKLDKGAKAAPAKPEKAAKASAQGQGQRAPRGQYANKKITVTDAGKEASLRGNRAIRWELVKKAKNVNDVLGQTFTRTDGQEGTITSAGISNFVERGLIELS